MKKPESGPERRFVAIGILVATDEGMESTVLSMIPKVLGLETSISPVIFERTPTEEEIRLTFYNAGESLAKGLKAMKPK